MGEGVTHQEEYQEGEGEREGEDKVCCCSCGITPSDILPKVMLLEMTEL